MGKSRIYGFAPSGTPLPGFPLTGQSLCGVTVAPDGHPWVATGTSRGAYVELTGSGTTVGRLLSVGASYFAGGASASAASRSTQPAISTSPRVGGWVNTTRTFTLLGTWASKCLGGSTNAARHCSPSTGAPTPCSSYSTDLCRRRPNRSPRSIPPATRWRVSAGPTPALLLRRAHRRQGLWSRPADAQGLRARRSGRSERLCPAPSVTVPTLTAEGPENVSGTGATLTGTLDPDGIETTDCHFEWGLGSEEAGFFVYTDVVPCAEGNVFASGSGENQVSATLSGLEKGDISFQAGRRERQRRRRDKRGAPVQHR